MVQYFTGGACRSSRLSSNLVCFVELELYSVSPCDDAAVLAELLSPSDSHTAVKAMPLCQ